MPQREFLDKDFINPEAPEDERHLRPDHLLVRDLSYERSWGRQPWDAYPDLSEIPKGAVPGPSLTLFIKERPRGAGYVTDFGSSRKRSRMPSWS
ncbi:hypothetical protein [Streptomyces sp. NPDC090026]|uniref:hypothetical protein n=1 Tax=Streptomyces sp. NPDC090026 TaxID=3365923 RepID=UPI0038067566